jgi:ABC-type transport system involved in cytochrome c biogenesis permease subunit
VAGTTVIAQAQALGLDALLAAWLAVAASAMGLTGRLQRVPQALVLAAVACLAAALLGIGRSAGRWPLATPREFSLWLVLAALLVYLLLVTLDHPSSLALFLLPVAVVVLAANLLASGASEQLLGPAPAVLGSVWWQVHVLSAAAGNGAAAAAGGLALGALALGRMDALPGGPTSDDALAATRVAVEIAFLVASVAISSGAVWAESAWGRYWTWSAKEAWALVTWLLLLAYLHGRHVRGWRGGRLAWLAVLGLGCVLFSLYGMGWLARLTGLASSTGRF